MCLTADSFVLAGQLNVLAGVTEGGQRRGIQKVHMHEDYTEDDDSGQMVNDIAVLTLRHPLTFNGKVGLIEWQDKPSARYDGWTGTVIGWGALSEEGTEESRTTLRAVDLPVLKQSDDKCMDSQSIDEFIVGIRLCRRHTV